MSVKTPLHAEVIASNDAYVTTFGAKASLALPPARAAAFLVRVVCPLSYG